MSYRSVLKADLFAGQTIIVTGGGSGIGRCTAHELSALGAHVVLMGRTQEKLDKVLAEIVEDGGSGEAHSCDIREESRIIEVVDKVLASRGRIDGLVNNAGGQFPAEIENISRNGFDAVIRNNLLGMFLLSKEVFVKWMKANGGAIVNITANHTGGMPLMSHSGAARAGTDNFTQSAAVEWGRYGVRVNAVAPGSIASSGMDSYQVELIKSIDIANHVPLGRMGTEAECSAAICFLLSEAASFITGASLNIDGAESLCTNTPMFPISKLDVPESPKYDGFHRSETPDVFKS